MALSARAAAGLQGATGRPIIDTITITTHNVFDVVDAQQNFLFRLANAIHFTTRPSVVRQELLFKAGQPFDTALVAETLRNLRRRGLFRDVRIDTVPVAPGRVWVHVTTADGWTTQLVLNARSTGGEFSWALGGQEQNLFGTGARLGVVYRNEPDRTSWTVGGGLDRIAGSRWRMQGTYDALSDGTVGVWNLGVPYLAFGDRWAIELWGEGADRRVPQYRVLDFSTTDTTEYQRRELFNRITPSYAAVASARGYVRLGLAAQVKREEYSRRALASGSVADSVTGAVAVTADLARARFKVVTHYNGFARDVDLDLSSRVQLAAWVAPAAFGYASTGFGPSVRAQTGLDFGTAFAKLEGLADGLFTAAGLDSGRVWGALTIGTQFLSHQATVVHVEGGARRGMPPGGEFDLGHGDGPRGFGPHAFTGTRAVWGSLEHRWFAVDDFGGLVGIGFTGFLDYGGAWFPDQEARFGGDVGVGVRLGATRATGPSIGRFDLAYRFGPGFAGKRWVLSFGRGFGF